MVSNIKETNQIKFELFRMNCLDFNQTIIIEIYYKHHIRIQFIIVLVLPEKQIARVLDLNRNGDDIHLKCSVSSEGHFKIGFLILKFWEENTGQENLKNEKNQKRD